jgi:glucose-1-phosphate cytidylyltransferase
MLGDLTNESISNMKTVILCGGMGTRLAEETGVRPKPMVDIGPHPILWHIMRGYAHHGFKEFVLALGYKGDYIKRYFLNYHLWNSDFSVDLSTGQTNVQKAAPYDWRIHLIDTGERTMTGGRVLRLRDELAKEDEFMVTYGDGVANVDITKLLAFHRAHGKMATVTAVRPTARFGGLEIDGNRVVAFREKPQLGEGWINGGFFVFNRKVLDYIENDETILEREPLEAITKEGELMTYLHDGFWQCMDTIREKTLLEQLWASGKAPWMTWAKEER